MKIQIENAIKYLDRPVSGNNVGWICSNMEEVLGKFAYAYGLKFEKKHDLIRCAAEYRFIIDDLDGEFTDTGFDIPIAEVTNVADTLLYIIEATISDFDLTDD